MTDNPYAAPNIADDGDQVARLIPARLRSRALAAIIDLFIECAIIALASCGPIILSHPSVTETGITVLVAKWLTLLPIIVIVVPFAYHVTCVARFSATPGKRLMHIQVVRSPHGRVGAGRAATRYLISVVSAGCFGAGYVMAFFDGNRRTLHDRIAGTALVPADTAAETRPSTASIS